MIETDPEVRAVAKAMSRTRRPWWERRGWRYNPFEHLDAARDPHLLEYLVVPKVGEILLKHQPVLLIAPPGGGKTTLRRYVEQHALQTGGMIAPVTVIPSHPPARWTNIVRFATEALARRVFWQAVHHFRTLGWAEQPTVRERLGRLWLYYLKPVPHLDIVAQWLGEGQWPALEALLGTAYTPHPSAATLQALQRVVETMARTTPSPAPSPEEAWQDGLAILREWDVETVWLLLDGLDGFPETTRLSTLWSIWKPALLRWLETLATPLPVVLKAFLPWTPDGEVVLTAYTDLPWRRLRWNDPGDLAEVIRARVRAASNGLMDSLDAVVDASLRPFEMRLLETLPSEQRLPRYLVERAGEVLSCLEESGREFLPLHAWERLHAQWTK